MKVYLVICGYDYEGSDVKACVSTREEADAIVEKFWEKKRRETWGYDNVTVQEWTVGEVQEVEK